MISKSHDIDVDVDDEGGGDVKQSRTASGWNKVSVHAYFITSSGFGWV